MVSPPTKPNAAGRRLPSLIGRRRVSSLAATLFSIVAIALLAGCDDAAKWRSTVISGSSPPLEFSMTRASDGKPVTEADYRGQVVMLYFGYTFCPDVCPTTLSNVSRILDRLGPEARQVRVLFVTVDPNRDTLPVLKDYVKNFAPEIEGLRGAPDQLAALARRYRVVYSVTPETKDQPYEVTHSSAIYVFDKSGAARLLVSPLIDSNVDIAGVAADLARLIQDKNQPGLLAGLWRLI
ncbi:MAG TPA: SCO family protein [Roseiarcus sp.]|jgi:protein SCO1/2|nr:SCO family protein [Roseiarcus sp.]